MNRKSVCIMAITGLVLTAVGCGDDAHDIKKQPAHLLYTVPANNGTILMGSSLIIDILLVFDRAPRSITVLGKNANIVGNTAEWKSLLPHDYRDPKTGTVTLPIAWVNPDGSNGEGAVISLYVIEEDGRGPFYVSGTFGADTKNLDPDVLNRDGIVMVFHETVFASSVVLALGESMRENRPLNWTQTIEDKTVRFERLNGEALQFNQTYILYGPLTDRFDHKSDLLIIFTTKASAVEPEDEEK